MHLQITRMMRRIAVLVGAVLAPVAIARPGPVPDYDFQWATIGAPGNPAIGGQFSWNKGRGSVGYTYRISKLEITTGQWMEFLNAIAPLQPNPLTWGSPSHWGARDAAGPSGHYELNPNIPNAGMLPVYGISWREAAMYTNWLCNNKQASLAAIANGAYDISTFGENPNGTITDQTTHNPGAKFWIPTLDEWLKAAHYDPNKNGPGQGGWWRFPYSQDTELTYGWPGSGQSSGGSIGPPPPGFPISWNLPLGAYADQVSPWGLWDTSGGEMEWLEEVYIGRFRFVEGSSAYFDSDPVFRDSIDGFGANSVGEPLGGLRVASLVPGVSPSVVLIVASLGTVMRRRRP